VKSLTENIPQERCPNEACDCAIPRTHVASNIDTKTGVRTVKIFCPHCDRVYQGKFELRGGQWQLVGGVELIADERRKRGMKQRVAQLTGQLESIAS
jgi:uncharacterized Fe-S cluster-containing protein